MRVSYNEMINLLHVINTHELADILDVIYQPHSMGRIAD
jgi:hypothetical protein